MEESRKKLYDTLSTSYNLGTFDEFNEKLNYEDSRRKLYDKVSEKYNLGTYEEYSSKLGDSFQTQKDTLETNLADFSAQYGDFMSEYENFEKLLKAPEMEPEYLPNYEALMAKADEYNLRRSEREKMLKEYFSNPLVIKEREGRAGDARLMAEGFAAAAGRMEQDNPELAKRAKAINALNMGPRGRVAGFDDANVKQYNEDHTNYDTARRFAEEAQEIYAAPSKYDDSVGVVNFLKGAKNVAGSADFWTMGMAGIADNLNARDALAKVQEKLGSIDNLTEDNISQVLSPSEAALVTAWAANVEAQARRAEDLSRGYQAGQGATESLGFMAQFLLTGGAGKAASEAATKGMTKWLAGQLGKMAPGAVRTVTKGAAKGVLGTVKSLTKAAVQTPLMPSTYGNISEVMLEIDNSGELIEADQAFWTGLADSMIETWSENAGGMVEDILGVPLKLGKGAWNKALGETSFGKWGQSLTRTPAYNLMKQAGWNGYIGELGEEWLGNSVRTLTGLDPDALKDFATVDQQIITMTSFAPMAVLGLGASAAQYKAAKNRAANAAEALSGVLQQAGYSQDQISFVLDDMNASTPRQLSETLTPVVNQIAKDTGLGSEAFKAVMNYADAMAKYRTLDGFYQREMEAKMLDARGDIEEKTKQLFYQIHDTGKPSVTGDGNVYIEEVRVVENSDGSRFFVVDQSEDGTLAAVDEQGRKRFITENEITRQFENGSITSDKTMMLRDFLRAEVVRNQQTAEQARMTEDARNAVAQIRQIAQPGAEVNLGTAEAPVMGVVAQITADGVVVQTEAGVSQLSWEEAGHVFGIDATPRTDKEIEAGEVAQIEAARAERMTRLAQSTDEAAGAAIEALDAQIEESVAEPLPLKADGSVDQTTLWNQNPERWAEWNDEQRQDGGANSLAYINGAITREEAAIAELVTAYNAEPDFDARASMEPQIAAMNERLNKLVNLQQKYAPSVQTEVKVAEEASEKAVKPTSGPVSDEPAEGVQETDPVRQMLVDLYNDEELVESEIEDYINANARKAQADLEKHLSKAPKMGTDMAKYKADRAKYQEQTAELEKQRDFWREAQSYIEVPEVSEMDMEPQNALEFTAKELTLKNGIKLQRDSFSRHTGYGAEAGNFLTILRTKANGGLTLEEAGERLMEMDRENNTGFFDQSDPNAGLNAILEVIGGARTSGDISGYIRANREQVAKEQVAAARNAMMEDIASESKGVKEWIDNVRLSEEVDQNDSPFVLSPDGALDFGEISEMHNLPSAPIRMSMGNAENGYIHINRRHGKEIQNAGFESIEAFVKYIVDNFTRIQEGGAYENETGGVNQTYLVQLQDAHNNTLFIQLSRDGKYWNVNSAGVFKKNYGNNKKNIWSASEVQNGNSAVAGNGLQSEPNADDGSTSNGTPSNVTDNKDSDSIESTMESDKKVEGLVSYLDEDMPDFVSMSDAEAVRRATEMITTEQDRVRLEEEKRATLRERIKEWEQKLGVQVDVMESVDDVTNAQAKKQILSGNGVYGWFDPASGKVVFYLPDYVALPTAQGLLEIDKTYIHEVVSHKGLRGLLGEEKFGELCDRVWEKMSQDDQQKYLSYPGVNGNKRIAADEYIASFAETINYESNLSAWDKIVSFVKDILNSIGIQIGLSENDLASLLHASYNKLVSENSAGKMVEKISLDEYLGRLGLSSPISDYMDDKLRNPHGLTESQRNQLEKEAAEAATDYQNRRRAAIEEYNRLVSEGSIIPSTQIDLLLAVANGHPDNQATQAARRSLEKRGYDWQTGQKLTADKVEKKISEADSASEEMDSSQKIDDFGEKIGGARKDVARAKIRNSVNLTGKDLKELKDPDKILSRKQIIKYFNEGQMTLEDAQSMLAANMAVRSADTSYKELALTKYRDMAVAWEKGEDFGFNLNESDIDMLYNRYDQKMKDKVPDLRDRVAKSLRVLLFKAYDDYRNTYEALKYPAEYRDLKSLVIQYGIVDTKYWVLSSANARRGTPKATMLEAVAYVKNHYPIIEGASKSGQDAGKSEDDKKETYGHLHVVKSRYGGYRIKSRVIPGDVYISQKEFYSKKTAEAYLKENAERLVERERTLEEALMGSNIGMVERRGEDYRNGKDVTPQDFLDTFGFRGVEFGNWVPQAERQMYLNKTYDAIMDLCNVIGISPRAFTLGGRLAIGFGSRGKSRAMAHYEPVLEVINLTRMHGAGSLAHEWFHALDNFLAKQKTGNTSDMITDVKNAVREEVITAFKDFVKKMDSLPYTRRSHRAGEYWGEVWERAARLFENYVYNELGGKGMVSPLLVRKDALYEETAEDFGSGWWPYPSERENAEIKPYFDALFDALQEQVQEDGNVVLYRAKPEVDENVAGLETLVERIYRTTGAFSFSGSNAIESSDDVAYIFRQLEDSAVENSFLVFVKDGVPTILHTGMGNVSSTFIDNSVVLPAYKDYGADKVYMVHNHPSGTLRASQSDLNMLLDISNQLPGVSVEGIIIDTTSGEYGIFDLESERTNIKNMPESGEEAELTVLSFDRNVFSPDYKANLNERKISNAEDVASFLSAHRLGKGSKVGALLLNIGNVINGNLITNENEVSTDNADVLARQIAEAANRTGSTSVILFGDFDYSTKAITQLKKQVAKASGKTVNMLDVVRLAGKHTQSMMEETLPYRSTLNDGVRFRMRGENESAEEFYQSSVEDFRSKYTSLADMVLYPINQETADKFGYTLKELAETGAEYVKKDGEFAIFVHEDADDSRVIENVIFHESIHFVSDFYDHMYGLGRWLWENAESVDRFRMWKEYITEKYEESRFDDEMLAYCVSEAMSLGQVSGLEKVIPSKYHHIVRQLENEIGYDRRSEESRREAERILQQSSRSNNLGEQKGVQKDKESEGGLRFRATEITPEVRDEMDTIAATAIVNGNYMKAPNGADTNLTAEQWAMVRTKNFLRWFGDWINDPENASKVVDENGEPKVVFHGGAWRPLLEEKGNAVFKMRGGLMGKGAYFTDKLSTAIDYAREKYGWEHDEEVSDEFLDDNGYITEAFLNIRNEDNIREYYGETYYLATNHGQIKSATDNTGEFSQNFDIRFRVEGERTAPAKEDVPEIIDYLFEQSEVGSDSVDRKIISNVTPHQVEEYRKKGINNVTEEFVHSIENTALRHETRRHSGDNRGQMPLSREEWHNVLDIIENFDSVDKQKSKNGLDVIVYKKKGDDGTIYYVEEIRTRRKSLALTTAYKKRGDSSELMADALPPTSETTLDNTSFDGKDTDNLETTNDSEENVSFRVTGTPTDEVVASGLSLSPAQTADLAGNIFAALPESARAEVTASLNGDILGLQDAIMQIPTSLAIKENWGEEDRQVADIVASEVTKMAGEMTRPFSAPEALWLLYNALNKATDLISEAQRVLVQRNLGFDAQAQDIINNSKDGVRYRTVSDASDNARASMYNKGAVNVRTRLKEVFTDMYASVEELVSAMEKTSGKVAQGFENILLALNQQASRGLAAMERYEKRHLGPMLDEIKRIIKESDKTYEDVVRYVILKHGLERNEIFAKRDAREFYNGMFDKVAARMKTQSHAQRVVSLSDAKRTLADIESKIASATGKKLERLKEERELAMQEVTVAELVLRGDEKQNEADLKARMDAIDAGTDAKYLELRDTDYSGITSMFYDQLDVNRADYETEEEYQAALMLAKNDRYKTLADVEAAAQQEVDAFESGIDTTALWNKINAATKEILRQQYQSNMISKDQYESLRDMFQYYVPLRGFADNTAEDMYNYYRKPNSTGYTKPILAAEGRKTEAESPFGWIAAMAGSAIASNVKNEAKLALYYFVSNRPDNGIATISKTWFEFSHTDPDTGKKVYKPVYPPFTEDLSSETAKAAYEQWQKDMEAKRAAGQAYESGQRLSLGNSVVNISDANKPEHIVTVKVGGKDYTILINGNPRAAQAINGDLNIEATGSADYSKVLGPWLRWLSNVNTSYNPEFWFMNMQRDMLFTLMNVSASQAPEYRKKFANNYMKAFKVISLVAKNEKGTIGDSYIENMYKDFVEYGGVTGYTQIKDSETWEKEIERMMNSANVEDKTMAKILSGTKDVLHAFHRFGESLEQVSRFAAFMTSREMGKSMAESISDAKEITVNFNRKGSGKMISWDESRHLTGKKGQPLNVFQRMLVWGVSSMAPLGRRFIMFFNAAIQGLNAMYRLYKNNPSKMVGWSIGYATLGVMQALIHGMLDDDDDYLDIPQYERRTALLLGANGVYFKWALPQEARAFYALGELTVESIMGRNPHQNIITEALKIASDVAPINPAEGIMSVIPSQVKPFVELWVNKDWKGDPIYNDQKWLSKEERRRTAKHSSAFKGTGKLYIDISKALNKISGGDDFDAGLINIQPEKMEHIVQSAFGGTIRTIDKFFNSVTAVIDPDEPVTVRQLPFINRFLTINDERFKNVHVNDVYEWYAGEAEHILTLQKKYKKAMDSKEYSKLLQSDEYRWAQIYSRYKKPIKNLQEQIKAADGTVERMELMKRQDELKRQMIKEISQLP